jgi:hypothetical protein
MFTSIKIMDLRFKDLDCQIYDRLDLGIDILMRLAWIRHKKMLEAERTYSAGLQSERDTMQLLT